VALPEADGAVVTLSLDLAVRLRATARVTGGRRPAPVAASEQVVESGSGAPLEGRWPAAEGSTAQGVRARAAQAVGAYRRTAEGSQGQPSISLML